ncbi:MAG: DUF2062 domain-containing protein [Methylovulum sp.]|nr:DUF2062 domain-containing protein [Methylovulum sp.]
MPKLFLTKYMPDPEWIKNHKNLQFLGDKLHDPNFWHLNRRSVSKAFAVGLFAAWIPAPGQMLIAASSALYYRANLPIAVMLVWLSNPLTMPPLFYFAYRFGLRLMNIPLPENNFEFSLEGVMSGLTNAWKPFLLGCLMMAIICSVIGYWGINWSWRHHVAKKWAARKQQRLLLAGGAKSMP